MAYAPPKECVRGLCPRGSVFTRGPMERGDSAAQVDRVGCATAAREGRCGRRTDGSRFCSASSSTTGRVVSPLMPLTTPGTQHHSTPSSLRTISRKNPARAGHPRGPAGPENPTPGRARTAPVQRTIKALPTGDHVGEYPGTGGASRTIARAALQGLKFRSMLRYTRIVQ